MSYGYLNYKSLLSASVLGIAGLLLNTACGSFGSSGSSSSSATTTAVSQIMLSATTTSLSNGQTVTVTASGGSGSYTSLTLSPTAGCGTISALSNNTATYVAPSVATTTTCTLTLEDSLSEITTLPLTIGATTTSTTSTSSSGGDGITITPTSESVALGGSVSFSVTGGVAPYSWSVSYAPSVSGGNLNASNGPLAHFTAPNSATTATIMVTDSLNYAAFAEITVGTSSASGTASTCSGTFNWVTYSSGSSTTTTLTLLEDSTGALAGHTGLFASVSGTCTSTGLTFTVGGVSSQTFTGSFYTNSSSQEVVIGTYMGNYSTLTPQ